MKRLIVFFLTFLCISLSLFGASQTPTILLMYFQDIEILTPDNKTIYEENLEMEMAIPVGSTIITGAKGNAELELDPNGTVIRLSENTIFKIKSLSGLNGSTTNGFKLNNGKMRSIATALTGGKYEVEGPSSVCGVRGTDFGMDLDEGIKKEEAFVLKGEIEYSKKNKDGSMKSIKVGKGQKANAFDDDFKPIEIPPAELVKLEDELGFKKLKDKADKINKDKDEATATPSTAPTPEPSAEPTPVPSPAPNATTVPTAEPTPAPTAEPTPGPIKPDDPLMKWLKDVLGMEIGSITIGEITYSKAVFQPTFQLGKLKTALYLPIIYEKDMFNPENWYHPKGNDEWSFGTDQKDILPIITDVLSDLFLKIKYVQWADIRDDFFFKVGNLNNFTIGHGLVMNNYANDADFPSIRRIGVNFGFDLKKWGFEALVNDLTDAQIFGTRVYFRPFMPFPMAFGMTAVVDINPAGTLPADITANLPTALMVGDPMFINLCLDLDFPIIENEFLSIIFFTDGAGMIPYFRNNVVVGDFTNVEQGLAWKALYPSQALGIKNIGLASGVFGNIWLLKYNLHARYFSGTFKPGFYGTNYDRISGEYAINAAVYVNAVNAQTGLSEYDTLNMGIYGQAGYTMPKVFSVDIAYMWPLQFDDNHKPVAATIDELHLKASLDKGVIPGIDIAGSLSYDRTNFVSLLKQAFAGGATAGQKAFGLIDEYTVLKGEIVYGVSPNLDLVGLLSGAVQRNLDGSIAYDETTGNQKMDITFGFETSVHF